MLDSLSGAPCTVWLRHTEPDAQGGSPEPRRNLVGRVHPVGRYVLAECTDSLALFATGDFLQVRVVCVVQHRRPAEPAFPSVGLNG